ncbi:MAG: efflux RND transporter periplasmic adaptor subunit [Planctomycetia bacterium]|nr:efflux RND transporter periplasmic adaptor subunit [Planctomycetia bacterium]
MTEALFERTHEPVTHASTNGMQQTSQQPKRRSMMASFVGWLIHAIPNVIVLAALGGLAWWGHSTGWSLPKFSELTGKSQETKDDWCSEHSVTETQCIECNKELAPRPKSYGWCREHGIAECVIHHPELAQTQGQPKLPKYDTQAALSMWERPFNNSKCNLHDRRIQFASEEAFAKSGVEVDVVGERSMMEYKTANGEIGFDHNYVARLSSRVPGTAWWVPKKVGESVKKGDILALIDAADVGKAKAEYLQSLSGLEQKARMLENVENLIKQGIYKEGTTQQIEAKAAHREAETKLLSAQQALVNLGLPVPDGMEKLSPRDQAKAVQFLGLPQSLIEQMSHQATSGNLIPIRAPFDGVVVTREVVAGEVVDISKPLFVIADTSRMWLTLNVRQDDMRYVKLGQKVLFKIGDHPEETEGHISWISTTVDEKTRTVMVRAELGNANGTLRASAFGSGKIILREEKNAITVPNEALQWEGDCHIVFVRDKNYFKKDGPKYFHVRKVRPGAKDETHTELLAGVLADEIVASKGSAVLRGELLKGNLGEG